MGDDVIVKADGRWTMDDTELVTATYNTTSATC
jgi:hypothetical protein